MANGGLNIPEVEDLESDLGPPHYVSQRFLDACGRDAIGRHVEWREGSATLTLSGGLHIEQLGKPDRWGCRQLYALVIPRDAMPALCFLLADRR